MRHKVCELEGALLDAAVAKALPIQVRVSSGGCLVTGLGAVPGVPETGVCMWAPYEDWTQGGPIIGRQNIALVPSYYGYDEGDSITWCASVGAHGHYIDDSLPFYGDGTGEGPTPLVAAMRAYVSAKLGDEVELP